MNSALPLFRTAALVSDSSLPRLHGTLSKTTMGTQTWVGDQHLGYLRHREFVVAGRWHREREAWAFHADDSRVALQLVGGQEFEVLDGYYGERAVLVLDRNLRWVQREWSTLDGDHDHCSICWKKLGKHGAQEHYRAQTEDNVCVSCFESYIQTGSLSFIPTSQGS